MIAAGSPHAEDMKITGHSQLKTFLRCFTVTPETTNIVASNLDNYLTNNQVSIDDVLETELSMTYCRYQIREVLHRSFSAAPSRSTNQPGSRTKGFAQAGRSLIKELQGLLARRAGRDRNEAESRHR